MLREVLHFARHAPGVAVMSLRRSRAELYEELAERADARGLAGHRAALAEGLAGRVLEIGCGTGRMFSCYGEGLEVVALEPDRKFLELARSAAARSRADASLLAASACGLPFPKGSFDAVVIAGVLCSVPSVDRALHEVHRVLRPRGELRLMEHVLSGRPLSAALMHLANPLWRLWNRHGCNMNRKLEGVLEKAGFETLAVERFQVFAPGLPAFPSVRVRAARSR